MTNFLQIFYNLPGQWAIYRTINNKLDNILSGTVNGNAIFLPIKDDEIYYKEEGIFITTNNHRFNISKEYIYLYNHRKQTIEKYFAKNQVRTDLFYKIPINDFNTCSASHQCNNDLYIAKYYFIYGTKLDKFVLTYQVNGPLKNYLSTTQYLKSN